MISQKAGLKERISLAVKTGVSATKASSTEASKDNVFKFKKAGNEIIGNNIDDLLEKRDKNGRNWI